MSVKDDYRCRHLIDKFIINSNIRKVTCQDSFDKQLFILDFVNKPFNTFASQRLVLEENILFLLKNVSNLTHEFLHKSFNKNI